MRPYKTRIVRDEYAGYEVQHRYRFWPFWIQSDYCNTHSTIKSAHRHAMRVLGKGATVQEYERDGGEQTNKEN